MLNDELIAKIRRIDITTRKLVTDGFAGEYQSVFKGRGMEFDEVRQYHPGDDVRMIDWNVTARTGDAYVKSYIEERELTVMPRRRREPLRRLRHPQPVSSVSWQQKLAAVLAFAATTNNDRVGLLVFTDRVELLIPPREGTQPRPENGARPACLRTGRWRHRRPTGAGDGQPAPEAAEHRVPDL